MLLNDLQPECERIAGSFRDPSGYVFNWQGRIGRAIDHNAHETLHTLKARGGFDRLVEQKLIVGTRFLDDEDEIAGLAAEHPGFKHFLEHERIALITYPYEWSISMLADAGLHTLELQENLLASGFSLKDASAYNIQFVNGRPTFIDVTSIDRPGRLDIWYALGQFSQMFTFPLLLCRYHGWDLRSYFLASINGRDVKEVVRSLGRLERWMPRALLDVALPALFQRTPTADGGNSRAALEKPNTNARAQIINLQRLRRKLRKLAAGYRPRGIWSRYTSSCSYDDRGEKAKKSLVREFLEQVRPQRLLDLGCNTGDYSYLAAELGALVIAADADHDSIDILYRQLRERPATITPIVLDLSNPSPAIGFRNKERASFFDRVAVDTVLALALVHHLLVTGNLSLEAIRDQFFDLTDDYLVLEYVPTEEVMFQGLISFRREQFEYLSLDLCLRVFEKRFVVLQQVPIPGSPRTLLLLRKKVARA